MNPRSDLWRQQPSPLPPAGYDSAGTKSRHWGSSGKKGLNVQKFALFLLQNNGVEVEARRVFEEKENNGSY